MISPTPNLRQSASKTRKKRFTYWTADGKRHWTPYLNIILGLSESTKFRPADKFYDCQLHHIERGRHGGPSRRFVGRGREPDEMYTPAVAINCRMPLRFLSLPRHSE